MKTALQILEEAWALLQKPGVWTQGDFAKTADGHYTATLSDDAVCFCSLGAICKVADVRPMVMLRDQAGRGAVAGEAHRLLAQAAGGKVATVNDRAGKVQDLAPMWERAIQLAKEQS